MGVFMASGGVDYILPNLAWKAHTYTKTNISLGPVDMGLHH